MRKHYVNVNLPPTMTGSSHMSQYRTGESNPLSNLTGSMYVKVLAVNWFDRTIDCVGMYNQSGAGPWYDVPILSSVLTQSEGVHWLPSITPVEGDNPRVMDTMTGELDAVAVIDFIGGDAIRPVCLGFVSAGPNEFSFGERGTRIERHASGIYSRTTIDGTHEMSFPDGTYFKVAPEVEGTELNDLSGQNIRHADTRPWNIQTDDPRIITMSHATGTKMNVLQDGSMQITSFMGATIALSVDGAMSFTSPVGSAITFDADGSMTLASASGAGITFGTDGSLRLTAATGSVFLNGVELTTHTHQYTQPPGSTEPGGADNHSHGISNSTQATAGPL